jgi:hypothetical protein
LDATPDEQKIARSLEIIRTSTSTERKVLKVLFYGQSITRSGWDKAVIEHWQQRYPNTDFVVENRALGGFASPMLERTTEQDINGFYPDLIIFHVYGDHRAYERIIRMFRSQTAADIIVQTDHGESMPDLPCREGFRLTFQLAPGCTGLVWLKQRNWYDEMSYHKIPALGKKYSLAVEPQRTWWRDYLIRTNTEPKALLADEIHPNDRGKELIAAFFNQYFDSLVDKWNGQRERNIVSVPTGTVGWDNGRAEIPFDGSRLELISAKRLRQWPEVSVDGSSPQDIDGCFQVSRTSPPDNVPEWPAIRRINLLHDRVAEDWTATLTNISPDQHSFEFSVVGSISGKEGSGDATRDYVSRSGRLGIEAQDWMVGRAFEVNKIPLQTPFQIHWSVANVCGGQPEVIRRADGTTQYRYVVATGLRNGMHTVRLSALQNEFSDTEFRVYKPPLR